MTWAQVTTILGAMKEPGRLAGTFASRNPQRYSGRREQPFTAQGLVHSSPTLNADFALAFPITTQIPPDSTANSQPNSTLTLDAVLSASGNQAPGLPKSSRRTPPAKTAAGKRCPAPIHSLPTPRSGSIVPKAGLSGFPSPPGPKFSSSLRSRLTPPGNSAGRQQQRIRMTWLCAARIAAARSSGLSAPTSICGRAHHVALSGLPRHVPDLPHGELPLKLAPTLTVPHRLSSIPTQQHTERPQSGC